MTSSDTEESFDSLDVMMALSSTVASIGTVSSVTVVVAFMKHKKLRRKIPNMFIIYQVSVILLFPCISLHDF